jgi:hypothetical protein
MGGPAWTQRRKTLRRIPTMFLSCSPLTIG